MYVQCPRNWERDSWTRGRRDAHRSRMLLVTRVALTCKGGGEEDDDGEMRGHEYAVERGTHGPGARVPATHLHEPPLDEDEDEAQEREQREDDGDSHAPVV